MDTKQDLRNAVQEAFSLDTPVAEPVNTEADMQKVLNDSRERLDSSNAMGLAKAAERTQRSSSREQEVAKVAERFNTPPAPPMEEYDRSAFVKALTETKDIPKAMSQEDLEESRRVFDKVASSGKTLDMMLNHMMNL